ncbi:M20 family metallo-hydrolase [Campylobacter concisus]|uniref:M20 family metallo-hydrolase n=1 Tax=Campylobacter concisus TaxID=199 RepID=UPI0018A9F2C3|nr:M20 family metallo-hydrolase [Campylobacter concisus]QPH98627.1 M20 family metallo-hydrolase [Campylobacter concisus]QPI00381.1 M20 family metallo-hydrolase [Campylobacter concisus]
MINFKRFEANFNAISRFGALKGGGLTRLAFSKEDLEARNFLINLIEENGFKLKIDNVGNIFAVYDDGCDQGEKPVCVGSHIDSVPNGGFYDGTLGVMAGLEALTSIKEAGIKLKRPLWLINFCCEESSRFKTATIGSKIISGKLGLQRLHELKDEDGISLFEAMSKFGLDPQNLNDSLLKEHSLHSYLELHIEQGPVLERSGISVGVVSGIAAPIRFEIIIHGKADHSGATPMNMRSDALLAASHIIIATNKFAKNKKTAVATIGYTHAKPGVLNVVPGEARLGVDLRDIDKTSLEELNLELRNFIKELSGELNFSYEIRELSSDEPVKLSEHAINLLSEEAAKLGIKTLTLPSGAGHDAMNLTKLASSVGMLFIPCVGGISHNIAEAINFDDAFKATQILTNALIKLSNE